MTNRVSHVQTLEDGLIDAQRESERLEILFLTALRHIVDLEAGFAGPMPEREAREAVARMAGSGEIRASTRTARCSLGALRIRYLGGHNDACSQKPPP